MFNKSHMEVERKFEIIQFIANEMFLNIIRVKKKVLN